MQSNCDGPLDPHGFPEDRMQHQAPSGHKVAPVTTSSSPNLKRRRFLFTLGAGGAGAAAAAVAAVPGAAVIEATNVKPNDSGSGYRETQHVRDYYRTAK